MASTTLATGLAGTPVSFATGGDGALYLANGTDRPQRWDGETAALENAGIDVPASAGSVAAANSGTIYGDYTVYIRHLDDSDIPGNFYGTPATVSIGADAPKSTFNYSSLPSRSGRQTQTQVWRNTRGQTQTFYLDTTTTGSTASSIRTDGNLRLQTAIRWYTDDGYPNAQRHGVPPAFMKVVVSFRDRMWYLVPRVGAGAGSEADRNRIYWSEAGEPEAFAKDADGNHVNVLTMQTDGDSLTGAMPLYSYLFLLKERHIYRLSTAGDPRRDAGVALVAERGCLHQRAWCRAQGIAYLMDGAGIYRFDGNAIDEQFAAPVLDKFRGECNFGQSRYFHVQHDPGEGRIGFFYVRFGDSGTGAKRALWYDYLAGQWYEASYDMAMFSGGICQIGSNDRLVAGCTGTTSDADHQYSTVILNEGMLDGYAKTLTGSHREWTPNYGSDSRAYGTITAVPSTKSFTDTNNALDFSGWYSAPTDLGAMVRVVDSDGAVRGQAAVSAINTSTQTVTLTTAIANMAVGDRYVVGGIPWQARLGSFRYLPEEASNVRRVALKYAPASSSAGTLCLTKFHDGSSSAEAAGLDWHDNIGVDVNRASTSVEFDQTVSLGTLLHRFDSGFEADTPADRRVDLKLHGVAGEHRTKLYEVVVDGVY